jgi:ABC-type transport system substrate-binding protein
MKLTKLKEIIVISLIIIIIGSFIVTEIVLLLIPFKINLIIIRFGTTHGIIRLDPQVAYDWDSSNVIDQVCEGLYGYKYENKVIEVIPKLAADFGIWNVNHTEYIVALRTNVSFHDGESFNADAVKFTFDRLELFLDISGPTPEPTPQKATYFDRGEPIINKTEILDSYTIKFILNHPFVPFEKLLCFMGSYILSPKSTPFNQTITTYTGNTRLVLFLGVLC